MQDKSLSQWFNLDEQKPWEPGIYEAEGKHSKRLYKAKWNGLIFIHPDFGDHRELQLVCSRWRGLASDPNAKPKPRGNRKVTRYVCVYGVFNNPCAVFNTKKEAEKHVDSGKSWSYTKIRFRTPEAD